RKVQCSGDSVFCWCVDADGVEVPGSKQSGLSIVCLSFCQLQRQQILCMDSGEYEAVQCDSARGQCWCVDCDGMEIYGTRQIGKPAQCLEMRLDEVYDTAFSSLQPGHSFADGIIYRILQRRFLGVRLLTTGRFRCPTKCEVERFTAEQFGGVFTVSCDENGNYHPIQCQRGGQCWCVDSSGLEIFGTRQQGGTLDCEFAGGTQPVEPVVINHMFSVAEKHAIFRWYSPSSPPRNIGKDCASERRQALSRLSYGPVGHFTEAEHGSSEVAKSGLQLSLKEHQGISQATLEEVISESIRGMFLSKELALTALQFTASPKRFQENLFGGKFLKNLGQFNFTGVLGTSGTFNFSWLDCFGRQVNLQDNQLLVKFLASILEREQFFTSLREAVAFFGSGEEGLGDAIKMVFQSRPCDGESANLFVPACSEAGDYEEVQCYKAECWCVDPQGREASGSRVQGKKPRCPSRCEKEQERAKVLKASLPAGSQVFIPSCAADGGFRPLQCAGKSCFCVDLDGKEIP
uniref:Thyroglobulin type-1 domain-containing protein n=1 Tax=Latimeria chalumnae TaxID=7897 RepID=H3A3M8_LATCH